MDEYTFPLYFESRELASKESEKVRTHFQKKRVSGGGECGAIQRVAGNVYKISFQEKADQERVLQRKFHTVSLPGGELKLTVSRIAPEDSFDQVASAATPTSASTFTSTSVLTQSFKKSETKCLEKTLPLDMYLLMYLQDNPKAARILQKQLDSIGCTVQLNLEEETAVVSGDVQKGPGGAFGGVWERWEGQVDRVMVGFTESYTCHHCVEPRLSKMLLQDLSVLADDMKVYTEAGYAVIVGGAEAVKERVAVLTKSLPIRREVPVAERQFKLVGDKFNQEMSANHPGVKVSRSRDLLVLEGIEDEVTSAQAKLSELTAKINVKHIQLSTALIEFVASSGAAAKYQARFQQSLREPVSIEVGSDLLLSSLSVDALEEAKTVLEKDLSVLTEQLQGSSAAPPELDRLRDILTEAKTKANRDERRVDFAFIPRVVGSQGSKVRLVGYSDDVHKLKSLLQDFQRNQVMAQELCKLSNPELVGCFDRVLELLGLEPSSVTLKASQSPNPCVVVSGPRCKVQEATQALTSALARLTLDTLVFEGTGPQRFFQEAGKVGKELVESSCKVVIREKPNTRSSNVQPKPRSVSTPIRPAVRPQDSRSHSNSLGHHPISKPNVIIKLGSMEDQQVNVLVVPMIQHQLSSTKIGISLSNKAGNALKLKFDSMASRCTLAPGDVLQVDGPPTLGCSKIYFIECIPWDGVQGQSVQALRKGLKTSLDLCVQQNLSSIAFTVIGPGEALQYPLKEAVEVLTQTLCWFGSSVSPQSLSTIHIVVKPGYPNSEECYCDILQSLSASLTKRGQAIFRSLSSDLDDVAIILGGGVKLTIMFGDITDQKTDVVVNSTDFQNFTRNGVCKEILAVAGPSVEAELRTVGKVNRGCIYKSPPGQFPCKAIFHVCGENDTGLIETLVGSIVADCEASRFKSVAIPAISAGVGGVTSGAVAAAILRGIRYATTVPFHSLTDIRLVLFKIDVFLAFKEEAMQIFLPAVTSRVPKFVAAVTPQVPQPRPSTSASADLSLLRSSSASQQSVFLLVGTCKRDVDDAKAKLQHLYRNQSSTHKFTKQELRGLRPEDLQYLKELLDTLGLSSETDPTGGLTVRGLNEDVNQTLKFISNCTQGNLLKEKRQIEEKDLANRVAWCIMGPLGNWEQLPQSANYSLENQDLAGGFVDAQGLPWTADLQRMEARSATSSECRNLKRLENLPDFTPPLYWDSMAADETLTRVALPPHSVEYKTVKKPFKKTAANNTVLKIERLQNIHLRRGYEGRKKQILDKYGQDGGVYERLLYHGTTHESCDAIMKTGFDRRFCGQNGTSFGEGVYFAVNASYSAHKQYSKPAADGTQVMFVARVLTGTYTKGSSVMKVPPPRDDQRPHDRFDSVVDKTDNPSIYVVFHDNQSYPDYLITFK